MRLISRKALRTYWEKHPEAREVLDDWFRKLKAVQPNSLAELRRTFPSADIVGNCFVFNVGGNSLRVITHVDFNLKIVWIRAVLSHAEYGKEKWKTDC